MNPFSYNSYGQWIGHYPGHFDEVVEIRQRGNHLFAVKVTGDDYVPAGEITWMVDLSNMSALGQIAEQGFVNPRFVAGNISVIDRDTIRVVWHGEGEVKFRRDGM